MNTPSNFRRGTVIFHWLVALLIIFQLAGGLIMVGELGRVGQNPWASITTMSLNWPRLPTGYSWLDLLHSLYSVCWLQALAGTGLESLN